MTSNNHKSNHLTTQETGKENHQSTSATVADPDAEHMLPDTYAINYPQLERDCNGWTYIGQLGGALDNWVDDPDNPYWGLTILTTSKQVAMDSTGPPKTRETIRGSSQIVASRTVNGYSISQGPSHGDSVTTAKTVSEIYGKPEQSPREVEKSVYENVLRESRKWMQNHAPATMRQRALDQGYTPDPLPEAKMDTDEEQDGLDSFM